MRDDLLETVEIQTGEGTLHAAVSDGFAEVQGEQVAVLVESCELAGDIDVERAERAKTRAEEGLAAGDADSKSQLVMEAALARAINRLRVKEHG